MILLHFSSSLLKICSRIVFLWIILGHLFFGLWIVCGRWEVRYRRLEWKMCLHFIQHIELVLFLLQSSVASSTFTTWRVFSFPLPFSFAILIFFVLRLSLAVSFFFILQSCRLVQFIYFMRFSSSLRSTLLWFWHTKIVLFPQVFQVPVW